jgi:hypothetical protein
VKYVFDHCDHSAVVLVRLLSEAEEERLDRPDLGPGEIVVVDPRGR